MMPKAARAILPFFMLFTCVVNGAPDFEALGRDTVSELATGAFDKVVARFDQKMTAGLSREKLAAAWQTILGQAGSFKAVTAVRIQDAPAQGVHIVVLTSAFDNGPLNIQVAFNDEGKIAGLFFLPVKPPVAAWVPPPYADPSTFAETAVVVGVLKLPGTVSMPKRQERVAAVVLVHGSGPLDRDETVGPNKVFKDLAWGLASRGTAVLRYDKRSAVTRMNTGTVKDEVVDDAIAAVELLAAHPAVDKNRIFVLGHSLGGMLAPRIAEASSEVDGIVVMAGATRPLEDVILEQIKLMRGADSPEMVSAEAFAKRVRDPKLLPNDTIDFMGNSMPAGYWLDLRSYHPAQLAAALRKPMLVLQGGRDYQVTPADFDGWKRAVEGRDHVVLKLYPSLNHLFVSGEGRSMPQEYLRAGHVDLQVISDISDWIQRN
jgi:dienelactone hydrolase